MTKDLESWSDDPSDTVAREATLQEFFGKGKPTYDDIAGSPKRRGKNSERVLRAALATTSRKLEGSIAPRVIVDVFDQAQFVEQPIVSQYLGGILAGARSPGGKDDRAVSWSSLIRRLSADQLSLHYVLYRGLRDRVVGSGQEFVEWLRSAAVLDYGSVFDALGWFKRADGGDEQTVWTQSDLFRLYEAGYGLEREGLIKEFTHGGGAFFRDEVYRTRGRAFSDLNAYIGLDFSSHGIGLFLRGAGYSDGWFSSLADPALDFDLKSPELADVKGVPIRFASDYPKV